MRAMVTASLVVLGRSACSASDPGDSFEWPVEPAEVVLAGLDGELVHVADLGSGPACDDEG